MHQVVRCKCGATEMLNGRCCGCERVRPSSEEMGERLEQLKKEVKQAIEDSAQAIRLEVADSNARKEG